MLELITVTTAPAVDPCKFFVPGTSCNVAIPNPVTAVANDAFAHMAKDFADGATSLLTSFAKAFDTLTTFDLSGSGLAPIYALSLGIAGFIAVFLLIGQAIKTAVSGQGTHAAQGLVGLAKFVLATGLIVAVAGALLTAADQLTSWINQTDAGGQASFADRLGSVFKYDPNTASALLLIFGAIGILVVLVLWLEMLFRHAAILVLIATSPIAAVGQIGGNSTGEWWRKTATSTVQLIFLKPVIALVFAIGFEVSGNSDDISNFLAGLLILLLAVVAWPTIAALFTFTSTKAEAAGGVGALLGFAAGKATSSGGGVGGAGVSPDQMGSFLSQRTAARIEAYNADHGGGIGGGTPRVGANGSAPGATGASAGGKAASGGKAAGGSAAGAAGGAVLPLAAAAKAVGAVTGAAQAGMQNTTAHAGLSSAGHHPTGQSSPQRPGQAPAPGQAAPTSTSLALVSPGPAGGTPVPPMVPGPSASASAPPMPAAPPPALPPVLPPARVSEDEA